MSREPQKSAAAEEWVRTLATATLPELDKIDADLEFNIERQMLPPVPKSLQRGANRAKGDGLNAWLRALDEYIDEGAPHFVDLKTRIFVPQQEQRGQPDGADALAVAVVFLAHVLLLDGWACPGDNIAQTAEFLAVDKATVRWALRETELHERRLCITNPKLHDGFMKAHHVLLDVLIDGKLGLAIVSRRNAPHGRLDNWFLA
jgi:hypothetical protein